MIARVADTIYGWGKADGYFKSEQDAWAFRDELVHLLLHQKMAFNSPVWFNVGVEDHPQCSACFINSVDDSMASILDPRQDRGHAVQVRLGHRLEPVVAARRRASTSTAAAPPRARCRSCAASTRSRAPSSRGGKTRRAAKMVILNVDHPDIVDFIECKAIEEKKAWALIDAGYDGGFNVVGGAYDSVGYQNANHSVRVTDDFMHAVLDDGEWQTRVGHRRPRRSTPSRRATLMRKMADAAWICGDPGIQFDTTINDWHPCINTARINASNPCSEYMFLDDSACNLASLNLRKFQRRGRRARRRGVPPRGRRPRSRRWRSSSTTRSTRPSGSRENSLQVPAARPRLRQPGRAADVARPALRLASRAARTPPRSPR